MEAEGSLPVHNNLPLVLTQSQMNPVHTLPHYFPKIGSITIFSSTYWSSDWSLSSGFRPISFTQFPKRLVR